MDTSNEYIKMCEKAVKIQENWKPELWDYMYVPRQLTNEWDIAILLGSSWNDCKKHNFTFERKTVWLPRQDQLQEIMGRLHFKPFYEAMQFVNTMMKSCEYYNSHQFNSLEQLWLAFVMKEKFGKVWNGEDWIKD